MAALTGAKTTPVALRTAHILTANVAKNAALLVILIVISRALGPAELGNYSLALAITTPTFAFALLGVRVVRITGPAALESHSFEQALLLSGVCATLVSVIFSALVFNSALIATLLVSAFKWSDIYTELYAGELQHLHQTRRLSVASLVGSIAVAAVTSVAVLFTHNLTLSLFALVLSGWLFAFALRLVVGTPSTDQTIRSLGQVFQNGLPLGLAGAVASLSSTIPQYAVASALGASAVGLLAVLLYAYALTDLFGGAYGQAWIPRIQECQTADEQRSLALRVGALSSLAMIPIAIVGLLVFSWVAPIVFGPYIQLSLSDAIPLMFGIVALPLAHLIGAALFTRMHYKQTLVIMVSSAIATGITTLILVPSWGIAGALWATVAGVLSRTLIAAALLAFGKWQAE